MKKTNSYIFLKKEQIGNEEKNVIRVNTSILELIKESFENTIVYELPTSYNKLYAAITYSGTFELNFEKVIKKIDFKLIKVHNTIYFDVTVNDSSKTKCIKYLEKVNEIVVGIENNFEPMFITIISYDSISQYYCNKIYPKLNIFERKLRKLLFHIYTINFGKEYFNKTTDIEFQNKIKGRLKIHGGKEKQEFERIKLYFYSLEYSDIQNLLFTSKWTEIDEKRKEKFLLNNPDLTKLSNDVLKEEFNSICPRSDWDRFFADKICIEDISSILKKVGEYRNQIAHFKFFYESDYLYCNNLLGKLVISIDEAIKITEKVDFNNKNKEQLDEMYDNIKNIINDIQKSIGRIVAETMQSTINSMNTITESLKLSITKFTYNCDKNNNNEADNSKTEDTKNLVS